MLQLTVPLGIQAIINFVLAGSLSTSIIVLIALVVLGVLFSGLMQVNQMKLNEKIQQNLFVQYSFEFAFRIPKVDMKSVDGYYMPELVNRFFEVVSLQKGLGKLLLDIPVATIQIVFGLLLLSFYNSAFIFFGILLVLILYLIVRFTRARGLETSIQESDFKYSVAGWLQEMARIVKSLKFSRDTSLHLQRTDTYVSGYLKARTSHFKILLTQYWSLILFKVFITLAILMVAVLLLVNQRLNVGQFVAAEIVILTVLASVEKLIVSLDKIYDVLTSVEKLGKVVDKPLEKGGTVPVDVAKGISVECRNLSFGYHEDRMALQDVNITVPSGSLACVVGKEGSGKSTLLRMLTGVYSDFEGQVLINNIPIGNYNLDSLRKATGIYLSQQEIFEGSLWENIALGECSYSPAEMMDIAKQIGLSDFIAGLRHGFDSKLDPTGRRFSKTTVQRILFLRAIAGKPKLLLLEEPWEGMEAASRNAMIAFLKNQLTGTTIMVATTDESFQRNADVVVELKTHQKEI